MEQLQAQIIYNLTLTLLFFALDFLFLGNKKPLFCAIIKVQRLLQQNRGVFIMSFSKNIVSQQFRKGKQNFLHVVNAVEKKLYWSYIKSSCRRRLKSESKKNKFQL